MAQERDKRHPTARSRALRRGHSTPKRRRGPCRWTRPRSATFPCRTTAPCFRPLGGWGGRGAPRARRGHAADGRPPLRVWRRGPCPWTKPRFWRGGTAPAKRAAGLFGPGGCRGPAAQRARARRPSHRCPKGAAARLPRPGRAGRRTPDEAALRAAGQPRPEQPGPFEGFSALQAGPSSARGSAAGRPAPEEGRRTQRPGAQHGKKARHPAQGSGPAPGAGKQPGARTKKKKGRVWKKLLAAAAVLAVCAGTALGRVLRLGHQKRFSLAGPCPAAPQGCQHHLCAEHPGRLGRVCAP